MENDSASATLARAVMTALRQVQRLSGVSDGAPGQIADSHASLDMGPETDWGHKSGAGAEIRFAILIRCDGEVADRARRLADAVRENVEVIAPVLPGWRLVSLALQRARTVREPGPRWTALIEYRARMLAEANGGSA